MKRRNCLKTITAGVAAMHVAPGVLLGSTLKGAYVRLGGPLFDPYEDPGTWAEAIRGLGYRAGYCPVELGADLQRIRSYEKAAKENEIVIAEVGAWSNPISPNPFEAGKAIEKCIAGLQLADQIGARCCVNISGSKNLKYWAGPHEENMTDTVFDQVVETTRKIIDAVKPIRTFFTLEAMPWAFPYSPDTYLALLKAIDRERFGVHLDPVNMITSPQDYYKNGILIREMFAKLGPRIRSCHAKDITLREDNSIPQLDEIRPGLGYLDYGTFLGELSKLNDVPLMMEHLETAEAYRLSADFIRSVGGTRAISL